jgi:hypothetical protein
VIVTTVVFVPPAVPVLLPVGDSGGIARSLTTQMLLQLQGGGTSTCSSVRPAAPQPERRGRSGQVRECSAPMFSRRRRSKSVH